MLNYRLKNYFSLLALALLGNFSLAQVTYPRVSPKLKPNPTQRAGAFIDVNVAPYPQSNFTMQQLITDVLMSNGTGSGCATPAVSNVVVYPNLPATNPNRSWGYFNKAAVNNFPFADGIVLMSGFANTAGNTLTGTNSGALNSGGDADLALAIGVPLSDLRDASYIEFDFVPTATQMKFNYFMASEEYTGAFPCSFADGFALLLKPQGAANYTNLAVLPNNAGPVSVTNIRPATMFGGGTLSCGPVNPTYFAGYNNPRTGLNFNGRTIPLTAMATVIPGQSYHIKMVIADKGDTAYDSAVFLEGGSFFIGVQILGPGGVALPSTINMCDNEPKTLTASIQTAGTTINGIITMSLSRMQHRLQLPLTNPVTINWKQLFLVTLVLVLLP